MEKVYAYCANRQICHVLAPCKLIPYLLSTLPLLWVAWLLSMYLDTLLSLRSHSFDFPTAFLSAEALSSSRQPTEWSRVETCISNSQHGHTHFPHTHAHIPNELTQNKPTYRLIQTHPYPSHTDTPTYTTQTQTQTCIPRKMYNLHKPFISSELCTCVQNNWKHIMYVRTYAGCQSHCTKIILMYTVAYSSSPFSTHNSHTNTQHTETLIHRQTSVSFLYLSFSSSNHCVVLASASASMSLTCTPGQVCVQVSDNDSI